MKNYFSVLKMVSMEDYEPYNDDQFEYDEIDNALVPIEGELIQDYKIGERIIPNDELLLKLHTACVKKIQLKQEYFAGGVGDNDFNPDSDYLTLQMKEVFDTYEHISNTTYVTWFLSNDETLPEDRNSDDYKEYKAKYLNTTLSKSEQEENLDFFMGECNSIARIEVVDIAYDFNSQKKIYFLEIKPFLWE